MRELVVEKLGWIKKQLGNIGNKVFFWKSDKINLLLIASIVQSVIEEYQEMNDGNLPNALEKLAEGAEMGAAEIVTDLIENPIMFGISLSFLLSRNLEDIALQIWWTLKSVSGKDASKIFGMPKFFPAEKEEDGIAKIKVPIKQCMMCANQTNLSAEDLGGQDYFHVITVLAGSAIQHVQDYVGNKYKIKSKETKCFIRGDDEGEITLYFIPINEEGS